MANKQSIDYVSTEHTNIRRIVSSVGNAMTDLDTLFRLETERFNLSLAPLHILSEKSARLSKTIDNLWKDLREHFDYEEENLTDVLGATLSKALKMEHAEIAREMEYVKSIITSSSFDGLTQPEMLAKKANLQQAIGKLCQMIEEHAKDEDILIKLVKKATKK
jgi:hemerythrin